MAGALEKEVVLRPFLGNVARRLVREAVVPSCFSRNPKPNRNRCRLSLWRIIPNTASALSPCTLHLAQRENCERLYVIRVYTTFDEARASRRAKTSEPARTLEEEEAALEQFILSRRVATDVPIEARCIRGNTGLCRFRFCAGGRGGSARGAGLPQLVTRRNCRRTSRGSPM